MLKSKPKAQKRLAKLVLSALLATSGLQSFIVPSVAHAESGFLPGVPVINAGASGTATNGVKTEVFSDYNNVYGNYILGYVPATNCKVEITGGRAYEVVGADGAMAYTYTNDVLGNSVTITDGEVQDRVIGGYGEKVSKNEVNINGGAIGGGYSVFIAGGSAYEGEAIDNHVTIKAGSLLEPVINGGYSYSGEVKKNSVAISGEAAVFSRLSYVDNDYDYGIYGGHSYSGDVKENEVNISGGTFSGRGRVPIFVDSDTTATATETTPYPGFVAGGRSAKGNVTDNTVTISAGDFYHVYGGLVKGETLYALTSAPGESSETASGENVTGNTVNIDGGTVRLAVGGMTIGDEDSRGSGNANGNFVNVNGGDVGSIAGGSTISFYFSYANFPMPDSDLASDGTANNNTVTINGGTLGSTLEFPVVDDDGIPIVDDEGNTIKETYKVGGEVFGGLSMTEASRNTVTVKGGNVDGAVIIGGMAVADLDEASDSVNAAAKADNNTVNILTSANPAGLFGGITGGSESGLTFGSGNTLNVAAKDVTAYAVGGFDNMNFYLPSNIANGDTMLTIKTPATFQDFMVGSELAYTVLTVSKYGTSEAEDLYDDDGDGDNIIAKAKPTDLTDVTFGVAALQGVNLKKGDKVTLIKDENGLTTDSSLKTKDSKELGKAEFLQQNNMTTEEKYELSIKKEGDNAIVTTVEDIIENETDPNARKSPVETRAAVVTMINAAGDLLAGQGMANAADAAAAERSGDSAEAAPRSGGFAPFAAVGFGNLRAESGSHVDTKSIGLNLGFAREIENKSGKLLIGPVLEYGHGNYDSYQDNGMKADGKASYWGIGVIAKQTNNSGFYYEGSLRVGRTKSDYGSDSIVTNSHISYDSSATYWAAHLGAGVLKDIGHNNTLDYYGKYFYSHTGSDSTTIYRNGEDFDRVDFDGVNSNRIRVGARITHALNERNKIYGGLAYQYEFSGEARATYREGAAPSPGVKGSSGMIELGWQVKPGKKSPMEIDIGVAGWVGKQRGITANVQANWTF